MSQAQPPTITADRVPAVAGPQLLTRGVLVIRWALVVWMAVLAASGAPQLPPAALRWALLLLAAGWTLVVTLRAPAWSTPLLVIDVIVAGTLGVANAAYPEFATVYPAAAALQWGAARGTRAGIAAGAVIGATLIGARILLGTLPATDGLGSTVRVAADAVNLTLAGGGLGFVATLLRRSAADLRAAQAAELAARERAARLTERESLGRQIHDSVLQVLALVHKRGRELAAGDRVPSSEVARLADLAAAQERTLRTLITRGAGGGGDPSTSLRASIEDAAGQVDTGLDVQLAAIGDVALPAAHVRELRAAVEQALHNVVRHADAAHAWVFVDVDTDDVVVTVRDDGRGFVFDEAQLRDSGKYGLLGSIRGRITELGGSVRIDTAPGRGTELELRVPHPSSTSVPDDADRPAVAGSERRRP